MRWDHLERREAYQRAERDSRELRAISDPAKVLPRLTETEAKEEVEGFFREAANRELQEIDVADLPYLA